MGCRRTLVSVRPLLKNKLERLVNKGVITPVEEPTEWISQTVITPKKDRQVILCIDPKELNKALKREHFTFPTLDDNLHELRNAKVFLKADVAAGYWHIKLYEEWSKLITFQTCYGSFGWLRLPFGLAVSVEIFQWKLLQVFENLEGIICIADDIIIHRKNENEHDENMKNFIECTFEQIQMIVKIDAISFMGHQITKEGMIPRRLSYKTCPCARKCKTGAGFSKLRTNCVAVSGFRNWATNFVIG